MTPKYVETHVVQKQWDEDKGLNRLKENVEEFLLLIFKRPLLVRYGCFVTQSIRADRVAKDATATLHICKGSCESSSY